MTHVRRFWSKVARGDGPFACWQWTGSKNSKGYGRFGLDGKNCHAHRVAYAMRNGPIPEGMFVCHRCDNPGCVRPDHLFIGTAGDNTRDMAQKGRHPKPNAKKVACKRGHPFTEQNTWRRSSGARQCRECQRKRNRERKARMRVA